ncbi:response regulator transcription factor [Nitrospirillum amazonense]|uniref:LuxR family two component transcriptional regulator n=1 Tax=Nitrospirillum amazonense TaxID=28077 RepID=A0A560K205_9PROT|nr:response regulator [Nitrospirillum amazonense]MDG3443825.1 response regulator [Nitrospirillum amazonense]TWB77385.1 LuxR family two component transcriptional regulator [Nitrospirillum amazonense]
MTGSVAASAESLICVIDDDAEVRGSLESFLRSCGYAVRTFASPDAFLTCDAADAAACLVLDVQLGDANGLDFQEQLLGSDSHLPVILISGHGDIPMTVRAMKAGAVTFLPKPFEEDDMLRAIAEAVARDRERRAKRNESALLRARYDGLTGRERDVMGLVTAGLMNKQIAGRLALSEITVKIHRGNLMRKMEAESLADLVRMAEALGVREAVSRYNHG